MEINFLNYSPKELEKFSKNFLSEVLNASVGKKNSLAYLKSNLVNTALIKDNQLFQVITIGGSHLESGIVKKEKGEIKIEYFYEEEVPVFKTKEIFFEIFLKNLDTKTKVVALNFAYKIEPIVRNNILDAKFIYGTKEHTFFGLENELIGQELEVYILEKLKRKVSITVGNDTLGLGLAALSIDKKYNWENVIVGVVGTGLNFGFFEDKNTFINLEAGNFNNFKVSQTAKIIDSLSNNFESQLLEKEVSGKYLSQHFNILSSLNGWGVNMKSSTELSRTIMEGDEQSKNLSLNILNHSAALVAGVIFGLYNFKKSKAGNLENFQLLALLEGSIFWKAYGYEDEVLNNLQKLGLKKDAIIFPHVLNSGIVGGAKLALL